MSHHATDLNHWIDQLRHAPIPVRHISAQAIARLAALEEESGRVDAHMLAEVVCDDPLLMVRLQQHLARRRSAIQVSDPETVTATLVHVGVGPFFHHFRDLPTVEARLHALPQALDAFEQILQRGRRAARFALGFAVHRMDTDADVVEEAALMHDFAEMLVWYHDPELALRLCMVPADDVCEINPNLPPGTTELRLDASALGQALMQAWRLPELLIELNAEHASKNPLVEPERLLVRQAVRLARHSALDWEHPALAEDISVLAGLLCMSVSSAHRLVRDIDQDMR
jgi:hypothetical protein